MKVMKFNLLSDYGDMCSQDHTFFFPLKYETIKQVEKCSYSMLTLCHLDYRILSLAYVILTSQNLTKRHSFVLCCLATR